jgi:hypothetical protein
MSKIEFWSGFYADVDKTVIATNSVPVKGTIYNDPTRFLDIYGNPPSMQNIAKSRAGLLKQLPSDEEIITRFLPTIPGLHIQIGKTIRQPPFIWQECSGEMMVANFIYNTNAIYRILNSLQSQSLLPSIPLDSLIDSTCVLLSHIYRSNHYTVMQSINNNINMFLISRVIEELVSPAVYNSLMQEVDVTNKSLRLALDMACEHAELGTKELMSISIGKGIAYLEKHIASGQVTKRALENIHELSYSFVEHRLAIDDRQQLINRVHNAAVCGKETTMCAILDDTAESVDDLLWIQSLIKQYPTFKVNLLLNTAQISINFSSSMMTAVLGNPVFKVLASRLQEQVFLTETFCPLISFQPNFFGPEARQAVANCDFVYIKGMNFFETCQLVDKDTFYSFVVCGPISRSLTGLKDMDAVFCYIPKDKTGYTFGIGPNMQTLMDIHQSLNKESIQSKKEVHYGRNT